MCFSKVKTNAVLLVVTLGLGGAGLVLHPVPAAQPSKAAQPAKPGDLELRLPPEAVARFGTTRFRGWSLSQLKLSPDGKKVMARSHQGAVVFDVATGKVFFRTTGGYTGTSTAMSRDGDRFFILEWTPEWKSSQLKVYQISTGKVTHVVGDPQIGSVNSFALAPDDRTVAIEYVKLKDTMPPTKETPWPTHTYTCQFQLFDLGTGKSLRDLEARVESAPMSRPLFSADGKTLYVISPIDLQTGKSLVRRFDMATGARKSQMDIDGVSYAGHPPMRGTLIATGAKIWDLEKGLIWESKKGLAWITAFGVDGRTVFGRKGEVVRNKWNQFHYPKGEGEAVLWDVKEDREIGKHHGSIDAYSALVVDDKTAIVSAGRYEGNARTRIDFRTGKAVDGIDAPVGTAKAMAFSRDGRFFAASDLEGVHVWDRRTGQRVFHAKSPNRNFHAPVRFTPDSETLVVFGLMAFSVDLATWQKTPHGFPKNDLCELSPDGKFVLSRDALKHLTVQTWPAGKKVRRFAANDEGFYRTTAAFSPDGKKIAYARFNGRDWEVCYENAADENANHVWKSNIRPLVLDFVEDGEFLAGASVDGEIRLWNPATGEEKRRFRTPRHGSANWAYPVITPDGKLVATCEMNTTVHFWDVNTGKEVGRFESPQLGQIKVLQFSPDGSLLAMSSIDTTVLVVDVGKCVGRTPAATSK